MEKALELMQDLYINQMIDVENEADVELRHQQADELLTNLLTELGFERLVEMYNDIDKYYEQCSP